MSAKYTVTTTDITVTIRERGIGGTLTFGVGGPIAAKTVADLAEEVNGLETELAALRRVAEAARNVIDGEQIFGYPSPADMKKLEEVCHALERMFGNGR